YASTREMENGLQERIRITEERMNTLKEEISRESRMLDAKQNEYNLIKSLVDNLEGFPESIRFLRKHANWKKSYPLLSDVLFCKEDYRIAIENYLEPVLNHYVVETEEEAIHAIRLLRDSSRGRAGFFVLETVRRTLDVQPSKASESGRSTVPSELIAALDVIRVESDVEPLCRLLLENVYILRDPKQGEDGPLPYPEAIVLHPE